MSKIARAMVTQFGMSEKLGNIDYANEQQSYLGAYQGPSNVSPETQKLIDAEVRQIVDEGYETAKRILTDQRDDLEALAQGLLEYETLTGDEIGKVIRGEPLDRSDDEGDAPSGDAGANRPGLAAIPKAGKRPRGDGGLEPQPQG